MIHGIGIDIIQLARIRDALARPGRRFLERIFCPAEVEHCDAQGQERVVCFAVRFAAKEAAFKAFRAAASSRDALSWHDFEVEADASGVPSLKLSGRAAAVGARLGITRIALSLSTTTASASAIVVAEK